MDLFICWANIGRSQVAEGFAKSLGKDVISCGAVEDYRDKYLNKPEKVITNILLNKYDIDISNQKVFYPEDILISLDDVENIYFLFDPKKSKFPDPANLCNGVPFWEYLNLKEKRYEIFEIEDPDEKNEDTIKRIVDELNDLIKNIYK